MCDGPTGAERELYTARKTRTVPLYPAASTPPPACGCGSCSCNPPKPQPRLLDDGVGSQADTPKEYKIILRQVRSITVVLNSEKHDVDNLGDAADLAMDMAYDDDGNIDDGGSESSRGPSFPVEYSVGDVEVTDKREM